MVLRTAVESSSAFAPGDWNTGIASEGLLSRRLRTPYAWAPSSTRATSPRRTTCPSSPVFTMMSRNCCSSVRRPAAFSAIWNSVLGEGGAPSCPAATCTFCSRMEAYAHRVVAAAEDLHIPHARQPPQHIPDVQHRVVAQVQRVVSPAGGSEADDEREVG